MKELITVFPVLSFDKGKVMSRIERYVNLRLHARVQALVNLRIFTNLLFGVMLTTGSYSSSRCYEKGLTL